MGRRVRDDVVCRWRNRKYPSAVRLALVVTLALLVSGLVAAALPTTSQAASWHAQRSGVTISLTDVDFVDACNGWAAGWRGLMLRTANGGRTWQRMGRGSVKGYSGVAFASLTAGWAIGSGERIWGTADGGMSWQTQSVGTEYEGLEALAATDAQHCWAAGGGYMRGTIYATADGGQTWQQQYFSDLWSIAGIDFVTSQVGWAVGHHGDESLTDSVVLHTIDGGETWNVQQRWQGIGRRNAVYLKGLDFVDAENGWVCGGGCVFVTHDGGNHWNRMYRGSAELCAVAAVGRDRVWVAEGTGYNYGDRGRVLYSRNSGRSWTWQLLSNRKALMDIELLDATHGWAVSRGGQIFAWY